MRLNVDDNAIALQAIADPDVKKLHWFINNRFIGTAKLGESMLWQAKAGHYTLTLVDDSGRSTSQQFNVITVN